MNEQTCDYICNQLLNIKTNIDQLLEQQYVSNLLAVANNPLLSQEERNEALNRALNMLDLPFLRKDTPAEAKFL